MMSLISCIELQITGDFFFNKKWKVIGGILKYAGVHTIIFIQNKLNRDMFMFNWMISLYCFMDNELWVWEQYMTIILTLFLPLTVIVFFHKHYLCLDINYELFCDLIIYVLYRFTVVCSSIIKLFHKILLFKIV